MSQSIQIVIAVVLLLLQTIPCNWEPSNATSVPLHLWCDSIKKGQSNKGIFFVHILCVLMSPGSGLTYIKPIPYICNFIVIIFLKFLMMYNNKYQGENILVNSPNTYNPVK